MPNYFLKFSVLEDVKITLLNCTGKVVGVFIGPQHIEYKVRYAGPSEYKEVYFFESELDAR